MSSRLDLLQDRSAIKRMKRGRVEEMDEAEAEWFEDEDDYTTKDKANAAKV